MRVLQRFDACGLGIPILAEKLTTRPVVEEVLGRRMRLLLVVFLATAEGRVPISVYTLRYV